MSCAKLLFGIVAFVLLHHAVFAWEWTSDLINERVNGAHFRKIKGLSLGTNELHGVKWSFPKSFNANETTYVITEDAGNHYAQNASTGERELVGITCREYPDHRTAVEVHSIYSSEKSFGGEHMFDDVIVSTEGNTVFIVDGVTRYNYLSYGNIGLFFKYEGKEPRTPEKMVRFLKAILDAGIKAAEESSTGKDAGS